MGNCNYAFRGYAIANMHPIKKLYTSHHGDGKNSDQLWSALTAYYYFLSESLWCMW